MPRLAIPVVLATVLLGACASVPARPPPANAPVGPGADPERQILVTFREADPVPFLRAGATPKPYRDAPVYGASAASRVRASALAHDHALRKIVEWPIAVIGVHCVVYEIASGASRDEVLMALNADPRVELAEPMHLFSTRTETYDDPYVTLQHGFALMNVAAAHERSTGRGVRVAVIDSGLDPRHPDIASQIEVREDFVPDEAAAPADLSHGTNERHALAVAGIIAATANNGIGIVGIAPESRLLALRACWQAEQADTTDGSVCNSFTLALALARAIELQAAVINLSLAGPRDRLLEQIVERALERGIVVVGAVPAGGAPGDYFPTATVGVIGVRVAESSGLDAATVPAPGVEILTLQPGDNYDFESGSSLAAAHVSGLVALLLARNPRLSVAAIRAILEHSESLVTRVGAEGADRVVDACRAVAALDDGLSCSASGSRPVVAANP
jgi:subtilisin family serine protease